MTNLIDKTKFKDNIIVDLDLRSSGVALGKKSFMKCEMTLFTNSKFNLKDVKTIHRIEEKTRKLINEELKDNQYFSFHSAKK